MPLNIAMRKLKVSYLSQVEEEVTKFLTTRVKHDYLNPSRELSLDLKVAEAEILMSANERVKAMAETGELQTMHSKFI
jgi:hypothetical protein